MNARQAALVIGMLVLPLCVICLQQQFPSRNWITYSLYKIAFLIPPLLYCRVYGIRVVQDIMRPSHWRRGTAVAVRLGLLAIGIFWLAYYALGDFLLDKAHIRQRIDAQFHVNATTILLIAPITILLNSLLEEFFYRGFAFGQMARWNRTAAYLLPSIAFTVQHLLFIWHWVTPLPLTLAVIGLFVFALVVSWLYAAYGTIIAPWLAHVCGDIAMMGIAITLVHR
jgi:membrane protease YdiL (CAAX protease family)